MEQFSLTKPRKVKEGQDRHSKTGFFFLQLPRTGPKSPQAESHLSPTSLRSPASPSSSKEVSVSLDELSPQGIRRPSFSSIALSEPDTVRTTTSRPVSLASTCRPIIQSSATSLSGATLTNSNRTNSYKSKYSHKSHNHPSSKKPSRIKARLEAYKEAIAQRRPFEKFDSRPSYKPFWLRVGSLLFLLLVSLSCIGLIEYARKIVPTINGGARFPNEGLGDDYYALFGGKPDHNKRAVEDEVPRENERPAIDRRVLSESDFPILPTHTYIALRAITFLNDGPAFATVTPTLDKSEDCVEAYGYCRIIATDDPTECPVGVLSWENGVHPTELSSDDPCLENLLAKQRSAECKYFEPNMRLNPLWPPGWMAFQLAYRRGQTKRCERLGVQPEEDDVPVLITISDVTTSTITTEIGGSTSTITEEPSSTTPLPESSEVSPASSPSSPTPSETLPAPSETSSAISPPASTSSATSPTVTRIGGSTITTETVVTVPILTITRGDGGNVWIPQEPNNSSSFTLVTSDVTFTTTDASGSETVITSAMTVPSALSSTSPSAVIPLVPAATTSANNKLPVTVVPLVDPMNGQTTGSLTQTLIYINGTSGTPTLTLAKYVTARVKTLPVMVTDASGSTVYSEVVSTRTQTEYMTRPGLPRTSPSPEITVPPAVLQNSTDLARPITARGYFVGAFLPSLLAVLLGIPIGILNMHIKRMAPFMMLSRGYTSSLQANADDQMIGGGAVPDSREVVAKDSLLLSIEGIYGPYRSVRLLWTYGFAAGVLGDVLTWCSGLLIAFSKDVLYVETVKRDACIASQNGEGAQFNFASYGCYMFLSMRLMPMRAAEALLAIMGCLMLGIGFIFWRWYNGRGGYYKSMKEGFLRRKDASVNAGTAGNTANHDGRVKGNGGVLMRRNPWSVAGMVGLLVGSSASDGQGEEAKREELKDLLNQIDTPVVSREIRQKEIAGKFEGWRFALRTEPSNGEVGIRMVKDPSCVSMPAASSEPDYGQIRAQQEEPVASRRQIIASTTYWNFDLPALVLHVGLLTLILYYQNNHRDTSFERWMNSDTIGVHFLFSGLGFLTGLFWDGLFARVSRLSSYRLLSQRPQAARYCILEAPSTNVWTGLGRSLRRSDLFSTAVAFSGCLAKFTPIFLANIPFSSTVTWTSHQVCTYMSVAILCIMILVLITSLFLVTWPYMPVETDTIAGAMYYVCDSAMLGDVVEGQDNKGQGSSAGGRRGFVGERKYTFGETVGVSGKKRIAVDYAADARSEP
ncbi:hypothetical protein V8F06_001944 [Rhypophila decipiens]